MQRIIVGKTLYPGFGKATPWFFQSAMTCTHPWGGVYALSPKCSSFSRVRRPPPLFLGRKNQGLRKENTIFHPVPPPPLAQSFHLGSISTDQFLLPPPPLASTNGNHDPAYH